MERFVTNLKRQAEENPLAALAIGIAVVTTASRFMGGIVAMHNSNVWAKEVARRAMKDGLK